ncbi:MAG: N-acyl homoserine lactonase family protein [Erythrobacter sp.]
MKLKIILPAIVAATFAASSAAQDKNADIEMWRLDCGFIELSDTAPFSDAHLYDGEPRTMTNSCYLIRHGEQHMLWDAGFSSALKGQRVTQSVFTIGISQTIADQLVDLGLSANDIDLIAVSHFHSDHVGQLPDFPESELIIAGEDWAVVSQPAQDGAFLDRTPFQPWLDADSSEVIAFAGDHDVFGDGTVVIKSMPGHTPGHSALLVRLPVSGDVLLTGDLYHFEEQVENRGVPQFNSNRADTLASFERFNAIANSLDATVIIQHDPNHIDRLPTFPESAE